MELLRCTAAKYGQRYGSQAPQVQSTLAKLKLCHTSALGGHKYRCGDCSHEVIVYNSCGDRHCPQCRGAKRAEWLESTKKLILDGVNYFHVVFTLPSQLSSLALGNRKPIYDLLFRSAWAALQATIKEEHGYDPAALATLHTWNQQLDAHAHIQMVVPGGGPALDGSGWVTSRRADLTARTASELYLVDANQLRHAYRDQFLKGLAELRQRDELKLTGDFAYLQDDQAWEQLVKKLSTTPWGINIQPPPTQCTEMAERSRSAEDVFKYFARYLTGGPISDHRIIEANTKYVTFWARRGKTRGGNGETIRQTLPALEFVRRWCLHILPKGYTKTRTYGGWHNRRRDAYLERCSIQLEAANAPIHSTAFDFPLEDHPKEVEAEAGCDQQCPACGGQLQLIATKEKTSWSDVMNSKSRPRWYKQHGNSHAKLANNDVMRIESARDEH